LNIRENRSRESTTTNHCKKYQKVIDEGVGTGDLGNLSKFTEVMDFWGVQKESCSTNRS
jgi:hypothetical protein